MASWHEERRELAEQLLGWSDTLDRELLTFEEYLARLEARKQESGADSERGR